MITTADRTRNLVKKFGKVKNINTKLTILAKINEILDKVNAA